ncbi:hypothetical protein DRP77_01370 [Candidatus Poribacteria bacterium]|nr:MAG: hypothetical protein DRP77_01370 [Candidatus Poribacteria bacterium]
MIAIGYLTIALAFLYMCALLTLRTGLSRAHRMSSSFGGLERLPFVSVVVAARNEEENLPSCLESLLNQTYPPDLYEIIVVDDRSTDSTFSIIEGYARRSGGRVIPLRNDDPGGLTGKQRALDKAIKHGRGEIILTTDADCVVPPGWIGRMVQPFAEEEVGVVAGFSVIDDSPLYLSKFGRWRRLFIRMQSFELLTLFSAFAGCLGLGFAAACTGNSLAYRRRVYEEIGGFEAIGFTVAEDNMLIQRVNRETRWRIVPCLSPRAIVTTRPKESLRDLLAQRVRWASNSLENRPSVLAFMVVVYGLNLLIYPALFLSLLRLIPIWIGPLALLMKLGPEYLLVSKGLEIFNRGELIKYFLPIQPLHTLYILICGLAGLPGRVGWKGRRCRARWF